jgi:hypothetical protein
VSLLPSDPPTLLEELCRVFNSCERAMLCVMSHGQLTIDGYIIRPEHLELWTPDELRGRYAVLCGQLGQLYGSTPARRQHAA